MSTTRALPTTLFSVTLAVSLAVGCGSIDVTKPDGAAGSNAGGTTGAAGSGAAGTTGTGGAAGSSAGRGGSAGGGRGGVGGGVGNAGSGGAGGRGGAAGSSAGRGGAGGSNAGRGGAAGTGAGGRGGAAGSGAGGRGGAAGSGAGGRGGAAGSGAAGRGGAGGSGPCICPSIFKPVCGVDGMTYDNDCQAACVGVAVAYDGMCVMECKSNADCVHYPDGVGDCCGACLPTSAPRPGMISCLGPCTMPITCPCVVGKCTATPAGGTAASQ